MRWIWVEHLEFILALDFSDAAYWICVKLKIIFDYKCFLVGKKLLMNYTNKI